MCKWGDTVPMELTIPAHLSHTGEARRKVVDVDRCIAPLVAALNAGGVPTVASCCGHGKRPGSIALADGRELIIAADFETARAVDAAFPGISTTMATGLYPAPAPPSPRPRRRTMTTVRERIETRDPNVAHLTYVRKTSLLAEWNEGNLVPADEVDARIAEAVAGERERCARIAEGPQAINTPMGNPVGEIRRMIAAAIRGDDHDG